MRKLSIALAIAASALLAACGGGGGGGSPAATAPVAAPVAVTYKATDWNAAMGWWSDSLSSGQSDTAVKAMIDHIASIGYSGLTFTYGIPVDISTGHIQTSSTAITRMLTMVDYAYSKGLKVNIKVCWTTSTSDNVNQWNYGADSTNGTNWFDSANPTVTVKPNATTLLADIDTYFTNMVSTFNAHHVGMVILGTENDFLTFNQYATNWSNIVANMRTAGFTGTLTYDAIYTGTQSENLTRVAIWSSMNKIGLSFYPDFSGTALADITAAKATWTTDRTGTLTSSCAAINQAAPVNSTSIVFDLISLKANNGNKEIIFTENTYQDSQLAAMNWEQVKNLKGCSITPDANQHVLVLQAQLEEIKTNLHGVVTGFNMMGYDPWEYNTMSTAGPDYLGLWKDYDQLTGQAAETTMKNYLAAGL
jgi:hypothetical protein